MAIVGGSFGFPYWAKIEIFENISGIVKRLFCIFFYNYLI